MLALRLIIRLLLLLSGFFLVVIASQSQQQGLSSSNTAFGIPKRRIFLPQKSLKQREDAVIERKSVLCASLASGREGSDSKRVERLGELTDWAEGNGIAIGGVKIDQSPSGGLGLFATQNLDRGNLLIEVPTGLAFSVESPSDYNPDAEKLFSDRRVYRDAPWWAQLSIQLNSLDKPPTSPAMELDGEMRPWLDSLPRKFDTPFHWADSDLSNLQYDHLEESVRRQRKSWRGEYDKFVSNRNPEARTSFFSFDDFVWGAECARSRVFSGPYAGSAFNPLPYALTLFLVTAYVGLGVGSVDEAANGAALVFCGAVLKDFVLPKFMKKQKYVLCPFIDMANHVGTGEEKGMVAFEYFSDGYSLAVKNDEVKGVAIESGSEVFISYGARSNDQLLQYYGFVEKDNPHDVYVLPPLRNWDIEALERACGRTFSQGRLQKLERAGLLGFTAFADDDTFDNAAGGVVLSRAGGVDPAVMQALRALVSNDQEWEDAGQAIGNFAEDFSGGRDNERVARLAARTAIELEIANKSSTLEQDEQYLAEKMDMLSVEEKLAVSFRIEKKKLLEETLLGLV